MLVWEEFYISVGKIGWMNAFLSADLIAAECKTVDLSIPKTSQNCWKEAILTKEVVCLKKKKRLIFFLAKALGSAEWKSLDRWGDASPYAWSAPCSGAAEERQL